MKPAQVLWRRFSWVSVGLLIVGGCTRSGLVGDSPPIVSSDTSSDLASNTSSDLASDSPSDLVSDTSSDLAPPKLNTINISPSTPFVTAGTQQQFAATGTFSNKTSQDITKQVTWSSSDPAVANISNNAGTEGLATTHTVGTVTITATLGAVSSTTTLTVDLRLAATSEGSAFAKNYSSVFTSLKTGSDTLYAYGSFSGSPDEDAYRAILEFKLPTTIDPHNVTGAKLQIHRTTVSGSPSASMFKLYGYEGDGVAELSDASKITTEIAPPCSMWTKIPEFDVGKFVKQLLASNANSAGFVIRGDKGQAGFSSSSSQNAENLRPVLLISAR